MDLNGKIVLVTGASRGIGRGIAVEMASDGAYVVVNYKSDVEGAKETLNIIKESGHFGSIVKCDVSSYEDVSKMIENIVKDFGKIDVLVNNAGVSKVGVFVDMTEDDWDEMIGTNLKSVFNCTHNVLKFMIPKKSGNIINISSMWGVSGASCEVIYSASKGGIISFTKALAKEMGPSSIRVNAIAPGVIDTDMNRWLSKEEKDDIIQEIPMMRFGKPKNIGKLAAYLACDESDYITGQTITVDGGYL